MNVDEFSHCPYCGAAFASDKCTECGKRFFSAPHPNVSLVIFDESANEILLVKEPKPWTDREASWEIPGGFVGLDSSQSNRGESLEEALKREMEEEIGKRNAEEVSKDWNYLISLGDTYSDGTPIVVVYFVAIVSKETVVELNGLETLMKWFLVDRVPQFEYRCDQEAVRLAVKRV